jgi:hypothetical protein
MCLVQLFSLDHRGLCEVQVEVLATEKRDEHKFKVVGAVVRPHAR